MLARHFLCFFLSFLPLRHRHVCDGRNASCTKLNSGVLIILYSNSNSSPSLVGYSCYHSPPQKLRQLEWLPDFFMLACLSFQSCFTSLNMSNSFFAVACGMPTLFGSRSLTYGSSETLATCVCHSGRLYERRTTLFVGKGLAIHARTWCA